MAKTNESARAELRDPEEIAEGLQASKSPTARNAVVWLASYSRHRDIDVADGTVGDLYAQRGRYRSQAIARTRRFMLRQGLRYDDYRGPITDLGRAVADCLAKRGAR